MSQRHGRARFFVVLGLPAFARSLGVTTVSGLLPVLLQAEGGPLLAGALVALEGVFALVVPPLIGPLTDRGGARRLPFVVGSAALRSPASCSSPPPGPSRRSWSGSSCSRSPTCLPHAVLRALR